MTNGAHKQDRPGQDCHPTEPNAVAVSQDERTTNPIDDSITDLSVEAFARTLSASVDDWRKASKDKPSIVFASPAERKIATALIGQDNTDRLTRPSARTGRFRPAPVRVHYEFWWWPGCSWSIGRWRMDRVENGRRSEHDFRGPIDAEVKRLKANGFTVSKVVMGDEKSPAFKRKSVSDRTAILARLGSFRP